MPPAAPPNLQRVCGTLSVRSSLRPVPHLFTHPTMCSKVWNAVDNQSRKGHTSIIHGKWEHEETIATASFAGAHWLARPGALPHLGALGRGGVVLDAALGVWRGGWG